VQIDTPDSFHRPSLVYFIGGHPPPESETRACCDFFARYLSFYCCPGIFLSSAITVSLSPLADSPCRRAAFEFSLSFLPTSSEVKYHPPFCPEAASLLSLLWLYEKALLPSSSGVLYRCDRGLPPPFRLPPGVQPTSCSICFSSQTVAVPNLSSLKADYFPVAFCSRVLGRLFLSSDRMSWGRIPTNPPHEWHCQTCREQLTLPTQTYFPSPPHWSKVYLS